MVRNDDGLLDIPESLINKKSKRSIRMVVLTKEQKLRAQLQLMEEREQKQQERKTAL